MFFYFKIKLNFVNPPNTPTRFESAPAPSNFSFVTWKMFLEDTWSQVKLLFPRENFQFLSVMFDITTKWTFLNLFFFFVHFRYLHKILYSLPSPMYSESSSDMIQIQIPHSVFHNLLSNRKTLRSEIEKLNSIIRFTKKLLQTILVEFI